MTVQSHSEVVSPTQYDSLANTLVSSTIPAIRAECLAMQRVVQSQLQTHRAEEESQLKGYVQFLRSEIEKYDSDSSRARLNSASPRPSSPVVNMEGEVLHLKETIAAQDETNALLRKRNRVLETQIEHLKSLVFQLQSGIDLLQ